MAAWREDFDIRARLLDCRNIEDILAVEKEDNKGKESHWSVIAVTAVAISSAEEVVLTFGPWRQLELRRAIMIIKASVFFLTPRVTCMGRVVYNGNQSILS